MTLESVPLPLPPSADPGKFIEFGREVRGVDPGKLTAEQFKEIEELLYKVSFLRSNFIPACLTTFYSTQLSYFAASM